jgi:hypothetical protein
MSRPTNKKDLLDQSQKSYNDLLAFIKSMSDEDRNREFPAGTMNRNIRDVLAHLHQWHVMMQEWYDTGMKGQKPDIPAKGYTWKTTPELNRKIREEYKDTDLSTVLKMLEDSFATIREIISRHTDEELFEKKKYKWTGTTSLGAYLVSATSSHYEWALKLIRKAMK